jgi:hypothetical protein
VKCGSEGAREAAEAQEWAVQKTERLEQAAAPAFPCGCVDYGYAKQRNDAQSLDCLDARRRPMTQYDVNTTVQRLFENASREPRTSDTSDVHRSSVLQRCLSVSCNTRRSIGTLAV